MPSTTCFLCGFAILEGRRVRAVYKRAPSDDINRNTSTADVLLSNRFPCEDGFLWLPNNGEHPMLIACVTTNERPEYHGLLHGLRPFHEGPIRSGYPIHEPCYKMLCQARGGLDMTADLQAIFDICASFPLSSEGAFWGHNHERLQPLEPPEGEDGFLNLYNGEVFSLGSDCHYTESPMDPNVLPELHDVVTRLEHHPNPVEDAQNIIGRCAKESLREEGKRLPCVSRTSSPLLRRLPNEIISAILLYLPSVSVRNLQLADPIFTGAQNFLRFWESRFAPDCDFWYVNETKPRGLGDRWDLWDQLCMKYHSCRTAIDRRRTLRLTRRMCDLIHQRHENAKLLRHSTSDITSDEDFWQKNSHDDKISLCRVPNITGLVDQTIELPDDLRHVVFSFTTVANQRYISGLRLYGANHRERTLGYFHSKGYSTPSCSHQSRAGEYITGFDIALDNLGIRGLRILTESGKPFGWVGEQTGLPKRRLIATFDDGNPVQRYVKQGFKLVGIAICSTSDPWPSISYDEECFTLEDGREVQCEEQQVNGPIVPEKETWYSDLPPLGLKYVQLNNADRPLQQPYHYCIFGGSRGERLGHLNKIVIRADKHVRSVGFYFDKDGEKMEQVEFTRPRYGIKLGEKLAVVSLAIDGAGGERITRVESILDPSTKILRSLQIFTNKGRAICSQTTRSEEKTSNAENASSQENTGSPENTLSKDEADVYDITQSPRDTERNIVGFFGTMAAHTSQGGISSIGVVCI